MPCECPTAEATGSIPSSSSPRFHCGKLVQLFFPVSPVPPEVKPWGGDDIGLYLCSPQCEMETFLANDRVFCLIRQPIFTHHYEKAGLE